jgi:hypothetical protein
MNAFDIDGSQRHASASPAPQSDPHGGQQAHDPHVLDALGRERLGAGVAVLTRRFAMDRITTWPDGSRTVLRTVAEQREAQAALRDAQWVVPVTADGYLLPSV